ncbi:putative L-type lectin-domain containing receptor kinase S.5 [Senna tora]|uniref:non-specific serine/threonine protein kinase n=1 Tax=Senna tora TaxID=362788 RepID=A0A834SIG8_9FABA|nr:putative L-type lectin-domain containing receptor kinase S.5 [Senna tora]
MEKIIEHFSHTHPLVLKEIKDNEGQVLCSGCEVAISGPCYSCTQCPYVLHKSCATLAPQLTHPHHPHPLTLLSSSPYPGPNSYICNICRKRRSHNNFVYHCSLCQFDLCMPCAWASLSTPLSHHQSQPFKHFTSHHHALVFIDDQHQQRLQYSDQLCDACIRPITAASPLFVCAENCGFLLHSACAELPTTKHHPFHPHPLTLFPKAPPYDGIFRCDGCRCLGNGFVYRCEECEFELDVCCALLQDKTEHQSHKHPLVLQNSSVARICKCCNLGSKHVLVCDVCDEFAIDSRCATLPSTAWHIYDKHPLRLTYGSVGEQDCEICKKKMSGKTWWYKCEECELSAHTYCVVGKSKRVKFGGSFKYENHAHPLTLVEGNSEEGRNECASLVRLQLQLPVPTNQGHSTSWPFQQQKLAMLISWVVKSQFLAVIFSIVALIQVSCFSFDFRTFQPTDEDELFLSKNSKIYLDAIQVTPDIRGEIFNYSGRVFYRRPYRLWRSKSKNQTAAFNTTFVLNISPQTSPGGEGLAFILTGNTNLPENSAGKWLGIVNATTNGTSQAGILAVEFDTRSNSEEDGPHNHIGVNINSINSIKQVSLTNLGINVSSGTNVTMRIQYAEDILSVFGSMNGSADMKTLLISPTLNLSAYLPQEVFLGFSASTSDHTELNCVRAWEFKGTDIADDNQELLWVWITVPAILIIIGGVVFILLWKRKRSMEKPEDVYPRIEDQIQSSSMAPKKFGLGEIRKATGRFSAQNKLGEGGFGTVYKGVLGGKEIAVKRVSKDSRQGKQEFIAEVTIIGSLHHKNLVKLIGWCYESRELLLVYEFMPNGSLDKYLYDGSILLSWGSRHSAIYGVAQALDYLHNGCEKKVLHRDIKASNILLDSDFTAKLGDFGLARAIQKRDETHHSTKEIAGTPGYMAPETFLTGRATVETDVYAFGVVVLEVVCGTRRGNLYTQMDDYRNSIVYWVWELYGKGKILAAVDNRIRKEIKEEEVEDVLVLGLACCHPNPHHRPSMRTVMQVLTGEAAPPLVPKERPAFVWPAMPPSFKEEVDNSITESQVTTFLEDLEVTGR